MNLLTLSAAFGLLVLIFQDGAEGLLAYESQGALESTQPILLFCVAFGLSTDYGVFLLTRIKEARDGGLGDRESVAVGLSGRLASSPTRRCSSASRSAPSPRPRSCSSRSSGSAPRSRCYRRLPRARPARAVADGAAGPLELVGAAAAGAAARPARGGGGMTLDADTALEPLTPTRWRGEISDRWIVHGPFGGYVAAFITRALVAAVDDPARRPRSLTIHYLEAPAAGPVEVCATVERTGRSQSTVSLRLEQDGRPVALALGSCATWRDGEPEWAAAAPEAPPPEDCGAERRDPMPGFLERFEIRPAAPVVGEGARNLAWLRLDPARPLDHLALTALSDGWMPAAWPAVRRPDRRPDHPDFPRPRAHRGVVLAAYRSRFSAGGTWEEDGELWAPTARCSPSRASSR